MRARPRPLMLTGGELSATFKHGVVALRLALDEGHWLRRLVLSFEPAGILVSA